MGAGAEGFGGGKGGTYYKSCPRHGFYHGFCPDCLTANHEALPMPPQVEDDGGE